ncbi:MAG: SelT/SelW/SelH family protein [Thermodesulfobacteriota bacterium]
MIEKKVVEIEFCIKCNWLLRSAWIAQELISTFGNNLKGVVLIPGKDGIFEIRVDNTVLWSLKEMEKFPDIKELKRCVRDFILPGMNLGHLDK